MLKRFLQIASVLVAGAFLYLRPDSEVPSTPPKTVASVDVTQYAGVWYEIASIPMFFQRGCVNTKATYTLQKDNTVKVENYCYSNGKKYDIVGTAEAQDATASKLKVAFPMTLGISSPYWIVRLGEDYEYAVVTQPSYKYIWILYREPVMPEDLYNSLIESISKDGYPVHRIEKTLQNQKEEGDEKGFGL